jgi:replication-associated recombination protein RarA
VADPLRQPRALLDLGRRPHPASELLDWVRLIADGLGAVLHNQQVIYRQLVQINLKEDIQMADLSALQTAVEATTTVEQSAIELLGQLAQMLRDAATDPAAIQALATQLDTKKAELADAVTANTPAAP